MAATGKNWSWCGSITWSPKNGIGRGVYSEAEAPNTVFQAELVSEKRGMVTVLTNGKLDFRFTLQRRKDGWKISSIAERFHSPDRTVEYQWRWTDL